MSSNAELWDLVAPLFHNYRFERVDLKRHTELVIMQVLRHGAWDQVTALFRFYGRPLVQGVIWKDFSGVRSLPVSERMFWGAVF